MNLKDDVEKKRDRLTVERLTKNGRFIKICRLLKWKKSFRTHILKSGKGAYHKSMFILESRRENDSMFTKIT